MLDARVAYPVAKLLLAVDSNAAREKGMPALFDDAESSSRQSLQSKRTASSWALNVHPAVLLFPGWQTEDESAA